MPRVGKSLILIENPSLIKIKAYSVVDRFCKKNARRAFALRANPLKVAETLG
jgi:hypothetical protein